MKKRIILLTKSRKHGGYCTAGIDINNGQWIRIVAYNGAYTTNEVSRAKLTYKDGSEAEILDIIEVECTQDNRSYYQPENYVMDNRTKWICLGKATTQQLLQIHPFEKRASLYFDYEYRIASEKLMEVPVQDKYSLVMVELVNPVVNVSEKPWSGEKSVTLNFYYQNNSYRFFRVTDDDFFSEYYTYDNGEYVLWGRYIAVISLGERFNDGNHYKLIAKMIPYNEEQVQEVLF